MSRMSTHIDSYPSLVFKRGVSGAHEMEPDGRREGRVAGDTAGDTGNPLCGNPLCGHPLSANPLCQNPLCAPDEENRVGSVKARENTTVCDSVVLIKESSEPAGDEQKIRRQHNTPPGGAWYWRQERLLAAKRAAFSDGRGVAIAWEKEQSGYVYGLHDSMSDFYAALRKLPVGKRHGYELVLTDTRCRNYADIEYKGPRDVAHEKIHGLVAQIRTYCIEKYKRNPKLAVCCSTRLVDPSDPELWKNSYHIVFQDLVFQSNHGSAMKAFWTDMTALLSGDEWHWDNKGKWTHIIDMGVYTRNRVMRLPLCSKRGGMPFTRISGDPLDTNDDFTSKFTEDDPEAYEPFVISSPVIDGDSISIPDPASVKNAREPRASSRKRTSPDKGAACHQTCGASAATTTTTTASTTDLPPGIVRDVQQILDQNDSRGCEVTGRVIPSIGTQTKKITLPCKNQGPRHCLATKGITHANNNAYMQCDADGYLWYKCHSEKCRASRGFCLGKSPPSLLELLDEAPDSKRQKTGDDVTVADASDHIDLDAAVGESTARDDVADSEKEAAVADASDHIDLDAAMRESTAASSRVRLDENHDVERGMVRYEETVSTSAECPSYVETKAVRDTVEHDEAIDHGTAGNNDATMPDSPISALFRHNLTENDLLTLLSLLSDTSSLDQSLEDPAMVTPILKRFGYRKIWEKWSAVSSLSRDNRDRIWIDCDAEACEKDLNDIVKIVNTRLKADDSTGIASFRLIERLYFPRPSLSDTNKERVTHTIDEKYLPTAILQSPSRVSVLESCTGTGKTTVLIEHARALNMPVISLCARITQVEDHVKKFRKAGMSTMQYDDPKISQFEAGTDSIVTTVESLSKVRWKLHNNPENARPYILLIDEFSSVVQHIIRSETLRSTRRKSMQALNWLLKHAGMVCAMDNEITDVGVRLIDTALSDSVGGCDIAFIRNAYKKYTGTKVYYNDEAEMIASMTEDTKNGNGFTVPCNTKRQAERVKRLLDDIRGETSNSKLYTSEEGTLPEDIDAAWSGCGVIYSPTITTGIDFNPKEPQSVYLFLNGEDTISPATALQMTNRNRNIKDVRICATGMKNRADHSSFEEMSIGLDTLCRSTSQSRGKAYDDRAIDTLQQLQDSKINMTTDTCEYTETEFSRLYKDQLWHENVTRSSFQYMLDGLLELRGFEVVRQPLAQRIAAVQKAADWLAIDSLNQQDKEKELKAWLAGAPTDRKPFFDKQLAALSGIKHSEIHTHTIHIEGKRDQLRDLIETAPNRQIYADVFTDPQVLAHTLNLISAVYTDQKLRDVEACNKVKDFSPSNLDSTNSKVILEREMIRIFNHGMPADAHLKQYDLTLKQSAYEEEDKIEISDHLWSHYQYLNKRSTKSRPTTRKALIDCIFVLSQQLFGKRLTKKTKTSKAPDKSKNYYNYTTDEGVLRSCIEMSDWSRRTLDDIEPEIVQMYSLELRKENDKAAWIDCERRSFEARAREEQLRREEETQQMDKRLDDTARRAEMCRLEGEASQAAQQQEARRLKSRSWSDVVPATNNDYFAELDERRRLANMPHIVPFTARPLKTYTPDVL